MTDHVSLFQELLRIRLFEETLLDNFSTGVFAGTTHTSLGQEANAVGVLTGLQAGEPVFSNHRCHGHFLAYGGDPRALFAELMGRSTGVCGGRGGSQHIHWKDFYSNGVLGSTVPVATGAALAEKLAGTGRAAVAFLGDGTLGEGVVYESFNMAALWDAPILFVVENNQIAQTTPLHLHLAGSLATRIEAFGIPALKLDTSDVEEILPVATGALDSIRKSGGPRGLILNTRRFGPHSKGDDTRSPAELAAMRETRDPVALQKERLDPHTAAQVEEEIGQEIQQAFEQAAADPPATVHGYSA